ncbi:MAG: hypothetical protein V1882_05120 [Candidatus Omnitrophota bacterium]
MQCPLAGCFSMMPKILFLGTGVLGLALGILSIVWPKRSIGLYQSIMARFNWKVAPIDESREVRNTQILGAVLTALSLIIFHLLYPCR